MNRMEAAIQDRRCVLALGGRTMQDPEVLKELRHRASLPSVVLGAPAEAPSQEVSAAALASVLERPGGLLVLVEPDAVIDGRSLSTIAGLVKQAKHKPRLCIAARAFNPFQLPLDLRMLKMEQERKRARDFLASLPVNVPASEPPEATPTPRRKSITKKARSQIRAPRVGFSGREEELSKLGEYLSSGGPIALVGPRGVGRHWLLYKAIEASSLQQAPSIHLTWGVETDALYGRLAALASQAGDHRLAEALNSPGKRPPPAQMADLAVECLRNEELSNTIMLIDGVDFLVRDDGTFHRNGRLQLLLDALLCGDYRPVFVFPLLHRPVFYREGAGTNLRILEIGGLRGRDLFEIFSAYRCDNLPRNRMGEVHNQTHGHPMTTRAFAVSARDTRDPEKLVENKKFLKMSSIHDLNPLERHLLRRIDKLPPELRAPLARIANTRRSLGPAALQALEIGRDVRLTLMARGLLDFTPDESNRRYYVHPLVRQHLSRRETKHLGSLEKLGRHYATAFRRAKGLQALALGQEVNRCAVAARQPHQQLRLDYINQDPLLESVRGLIRGMRPHLGLAQDRLNRILKTDPGNTEAWLLSVELAAASKQSPDSISAIYKKAAAKAPTPELFHHEATWQLQREPPALAAAVAALEKGCEVLPRNGRLRRRLAGLLIRDQRQDDAIPILRTTLDLEPMMPDTYGLLGEILVGKGPRHWEQAAAYLDEALRLAPDDPVHLARQGRLLRLKGLADRENRQQLWSQAEELFEKATRSPRKNAACFFEMITLMLDRDDPPPDLDRVAWLLKQADKLKEHLPHLPIIRARFKARTGRHLEAEKSLSRLVKREPRNFLARAALAEVLFSMSRVFEAHSHYSRAQEDAPPNAPERQAYETMMEQLRALIDSGQAIEMQKRAEERARSGAPAPSRPSVPTDSGKPTTILNRRPGRASRKHTAQRPGKNAPSQVGPAESTVAVASSSQPPEPETGPARLTPAANHPSAAPAPEEPSATEPANEPAPVPPEAIQQPASPTPEEPLHTDLPDKQD